MPYKIPWNEGKTRGGEEPRVLEIFFLFRMEDSMEYDQKCVPYKTPRNEGKKRNRKKNPCTHGRKKSIRNVPLSSQILFPGSQGFECPCHIVVDQSDFLRHEFIRILSVKCHRGIHATPRAGKLGFSSFYRMDITNLRGYSFTHFNVKVFYSWLPGPEKNVPWGIYIELV